jgi:hypothetical protein
VFRDQWQGEGEDLVPPLHINLQLQAQIGVTTAEFGWIVVCVGGNKLQRVKVPRHQPTQIRLREAIDLFWQGVRAGAEPRWLADGDTVTRLATMAEPDERTPALDLCDNEAACRDLRRYLRWKRHSDFVCGQLDGMKARIGLLMTDCTRAIGADGITVSWPCYTRAAKQIPARWQDEKIIRGGFTVKLPKGKK